MLDIFSRWLHIVAAAVAVGGFIYARLIVAPSLDTIPEEQRASLIGQFSARLRPIALLVMVLLIATGSYNLLLVLQKGVAAGYHVAFGIKFLLALHIFGVFYLVSAPLTGDRGRDAKRLRLMTGAVISSLIVLAIGAYLRTLHG